MDYKTNATSRKELRKLARVFDILFETTDLMFKPVVKLLDRLNSVMPFVNYEIVDDNSFSKNVPARGVLKNKEYIIEIKEYVYINACNNNGCCRGIIMHEIFHPFLFSLGFIPSFDKCYKDGELNPYESVEWQVKVITAEYMMDYDKTKSLTIEEIMKQCVVSKGFAQNRKKH